MTLSATQPLSSPAASGSTGFPSLRTEDWLPYAILALLLIAIYYRVAAKLVFDWYDIPDYSHGFLVPLFSLFLLWDKRDILRATPVAQSWKGLLLVVPGICVLILGIYGADLFLSRTSLILLLAPGVDLRWPRDAQRRQVSLACVAAGHSFSGYRLQPDHLSAPASGHAACQCHPASVRSPGVA